MTVRVAGSRDVALTELPIRGISLNDATNGSATINIVASDSGIIFINKMVSDVTYNLPALADGKGKMWWFYNAEGANDIIITAPSANLFANDAQNTTVTSGTQHGISGMVVGDGSFYYFIEFHGAWTST